MALFSIYNTAQLAGAYGVIDKANPVILDKFFPEQINFTTEYVVFDRVTRARNLAPLVMPSDTGPEGRLRPYTATQVNPAYIKVRNSIEPYKTLARRAGEGIAGETSPQERFQAIVLDQLGIQYNQIVRREEYMAIQAVTTGTVTLSGPEYATQVVDFQRNPTHTVSLVAQPTAWGQAGVDPVENLMQWNTLVQKDSGYAVTDVYMDIGAYNFLRLSPGGALIMNYFRQQTGNINMEGGAVGGIGNEVKLVAEIGGMNIWLYQGYYTDSNGNAQPLMPANTVIMGSPAGASGTRLYGAIQDFEAGMVATEKYSKMWVEHNPSVAQLMTQSAPLPYLPWPDATFCATVA